MCVYVGGGENDNDTYIEEKIINSPTQLESGYSQVLTNNYSATVNINIHDDITLTHVNSNKAAHISLGSDHPFAAIRQGKLHHSFASATFTMHACWQVVLICSVANFQQIAEILLAMRFPHPCSTKAIVQEITGSKTSACKVA